MAYTTIRRKSAPQGGDDPKKPKSSVTLGFKRGRETSTYTPARVFTGDTRYGKDDPNRKDPKFIERARQAKVDVVRDDEGKPFVAGYTKTTKEPDRVTMDVKLSKNIPRPLRPFKKASDIRQKNSPGPKSRKPRVFYLQGHGHGRNKRTEGGY